ncbi:MAG: hypothetical protein O3B08_17110 [Proteobacteria bacterium]|nr:hypothetical protein [Pseudomonadota bacterium]
MTTLIALPVRNAPMIDEMLLCAWVAQAAPGQVLEYHRGFLGIDRTPFGQPMTADGRAALIRTSGRALNLAAGGFVHLVQRRLGPGTFSYLAVARARPKSAPVSFATLMTGEAA